MKTRQANQRSGFERRIPETPVRERYQGCLLGGAVGDALGAPVEFESRAEILRQYGPIGITDLAPAFGKLGAITDDTQMTLFTAEGAIRAYVRGTLRGICHPPIVVHYAYLRWRYTQGDFEPNDEAFLLNGWLIGQKELFARRAPGITCLGALSRERDIGKPARNDSKGCGGVIRVAPIGMLFHALARGGTGEGSLQSAFDFGCEAAALTHGHPTGYLTAGVMAALVLDLLDGANLSAALGRVIPLLENRERHGETLAALERARELSLSDVPPAEAIDQLGEGWIAEEALAIGVYCALKAVDFESGVIMAVNHDGDSDSTGLIAGHLLGAMRGRASIPQRWLAPLELRGVIEEIADDLATVPSWRLGESDDPGARDEADYYTQRYPGA